MEYEVNTLDLCRTNYETNVNSWTKSNTLGIENEKNNATLGIENENFMVLLPIYFEKWIIFVALNHYLNLIARRLHPPVVRDFPTNLLYRSR